MDVNGCGSAQVCVYPASITHVGAGLLFWQLWRFGNSNSKVCTILDNKTLIPFCDLTFW